MANWVREKYMHTQKAGGFLTACRIQIEWVFLGQTTCWFCTLRQIWPISPSLSMLSFSHLYATAAAASLQSCPTLCDPIDGSPPGSPIPGILLARTLEWVAISFSNAWKWKVKVKFLSCVRPSATPWTVAYQVPLSMGFSRQEYWSGMPLPSLSFIWCLLKWKVHQGLHFVTPA